MKSYQKPQIQLLHVVPTTLIAASSSAIGIGRNDYNGTDDILSKQRGGDAGYSNNSGSFGDLW